MVTEITETISTDYSGPETITTTTTYTAEHTQPPGEDAAPPVRKKTIRTKVDPSKFLTPYLEHSNKMKDLFSEVGCLISHFLSNTNFKTVSQGLFDSYSANNWVYQWGECNKLEVIQVRDGFFPVVSDGIVSAEISISANVVE